MQLINKSDETILVKAQGMPRWGDAGLDERFYIDKSIKIDYRLSVFQETIGVIHSQICRKCSTPNFKRRNSGPNKSRTAKFWNFQNITRDSGVEVKC